MKKHPSHTQKKQVLTRVEFSSQEFADHKKNELWYLGVGLLLLTTIYLAIRYHDYILSAVIVAAGIAIFRLGNLKPGHREIKITDQGVTWGGDFFAYHKLRCFWVAQSGESTMIYLERLNLSPVISLSIPENKVEAAIEVLSENLPHHDHKSEPMVDKFGRFFRI